MEPTYISWTPTNWITVFLMAFGGFVIARLVLSLVKGTKQNPSGSAS